MKKLTHTHHIVPKHMGGSDDPENLIELSVEEHSKIHLELYERYGKKEDLCAYYMLSGKNQDPEFVRLRASIGGKASHNARLEKGIAHLPFLGANLTEEEKKSIASQGGKVQGKINADNGHMNRIQKLADCSSAGKIGGATTVARGKGAFGDPVQRKLVASKGGKVQGRRNAESGHLKEITKLSKRNLGMFWITDGESNEMVRDLSEIKDGWYRGKTQKRKV